MVTAVDISCYGIETTSVMLLLLSLFVLKITTKDKEPVYLIVIAILGLVLWGMHCHTLKTLIYGV